MPASGTVIVPAQGGVEFDAYLNGQGPYRLILDSGAGVNILSPAVASQLHLQVEGDPLGLAGAGGPAQAKAARLDSLRIGSLEARGQWFYVLPMPWGDKPGPVGAVGYELLSRIVTTVDYEHARLILQLPQNFTAPMNAVKIALLPVERSIEVKGSVDGAAGVFGIDTGDESSLSLQPQFAEKNGLEKILHPRFEGYVSSGVGGALSSASYARVRSFRISDAEVNDAITYLYKGRFITEEIDGNIGTRVLRHFNITFDLPQGVVYFEKNAIWGEREIFNRAGIVIDSIQQDQVIRNVLPGSPGDVAGLKVGDEVLEIDGRKPNGDPLQQNDPAFLQRAGTKVNLTVKRGEKRISIAVRLRDIF